MHLLHPTECCVPRHSLISLSRAFSPAAAFCLRITWKFYCPKLRSSPSPSTMDGWILAAEEPPWLPRHWGKEALHQNSCSLVTRHVQSRWHKGVGPPAVSWLAKAGETLRDLFGCWSWQQTSACTSGETWGRDQDSWAACICPRQWSSGLRSEQNLRVQGLWRQPCTRLLCFQLSLLHPVWVLGESPGLPWCRRLDTSTQTAWRLDGGVLPIRA